MSLYIIVPDDAKILANKLRESLQSSAEHIHTLSVEDLLKKELPQTDTQVRVVLLTKLLWQEIQGRPKEDICEMFSKPDDTIVLISCTKYIEEAAINFFSKIVIGWKTVRYYMASGEDWFKAEVRMRYRLQQGKNEEVQIPIASRYVIKPDSVTKLSESKSEVLVILLADETSDLTDVSKLEIAVGNNLLKARKIESNVWSFNAFDLQPGDHVIRVQADDIDLGPNALHIQDKDAAIKELLVDLKKRDSKRFVAELLDVDIEYFDRDLLDKIDGSSVSLVETLLRYGDGKDCEYPNFLHFCAKHGLEEITQWYKKETKDFNEKCSVQNNAGKIPQQVARETKQNMKLITMLEIQEELQAIKSPFKDACRDSGLFTEGSRDSLDIRSSLRLQNRDPILVPTDRQKPTEHTDTKQTNEPDRRFAFTRRSRDYNEIDDDSDDGHSPYNRAWDTKTIFPNRQAQTFSGKSLSKSMPDNLKN